MPPPKPTGPLPTYCSGACRKAAFDARRARKPAAFETKIVAHETTIEHDLTECVTRVTASPAACRRVLNELARMVREQKMDDPRWDTTRAAFATLSDAIAFGRGGVQPRFRRLLR